MEFVEEKALIEGYLKWKGEYKVGDTSPEAFLKWRTRESAFDKLVLIDNAIALVLEHPENYEVVEVALGIRDIINDGI